MSIFVPGRLPKHRPLNFHDKLRAGVGDNGKIGIRALRYFLFQFNLQLSVIILLIFHNCLYIIIIYIDRGKYTSFHREHTTYSGVKKATAPIKHKKKFRPCKPAGLQGRNLYTAAVSSTASRLSQFSRMQRQVNAFASSAFSEKISVCISFTRALSPK